MDGDGVTPVVLALPLEDARAALARRGWECAGVTVTAPFPRRDGLHPQGDEGITAGEMLVVRQRQAGSASVLLTVARHPGHPGPL